MNSKKDILSGLVFAIGDSFYLYFCKDIVPFTGKGTTPFRTSLEASFHHS